MKELLKVDKLKVDFAAYNGTVHAVRGVSFSIFEGETLALVGESGCGKSTLARILMRLTEADSGEIYFDGDQISGLADLLTIPRRDLNRIRGSEISMVFQDAMASLNPTMTVGAQMIETLRAHRQISKPEAAARGAELLTLVEMNGAKELLKRYPHELSGGQRQRVMIAMALSCEPKLLIADEPTTALDVTVQAQILSLLQRLQKQLGMSVLLITHDLGIAAGIADRVQVMYAGQIVEKGSLKELFTAPRHPYTAALLTAIPRQNTSRRSELYALPGTPPDLRLTLDCCPFVYRCRFAMAVCRKQNPEETDGCRCWLCHPMAPKVDVLGGGEHA